MSLKYEKGLKFESWIYILKYETWTTFQGIQHFFVTRFHVSEMKGQYLFDLLPVIF